MIPHPWLRRIADRLGELVPSPPADAAPAGLLVGLSGGPDSVALLLAARLWARDRGAPLAAAHLNHALRAADADGDEAFCRDLCRRLDVPLHCRREDPRPLARRRGRGLEEAGRALRRHFFLSLLASEPGLGRIATGHHLDDQVETVVMRLFRGTGPDGLRGIRPVSGPFVRPLLEVGRTEIVAFLAEVGQPWRTDAGNLEGDNVRARLRRELLPLARDIFGGGADRAPARLAGLLAADLDYLAERTGAALDALRRPAGGDELDLPGLLALPPALAARVLRDWLREAGGDAPERIEAAHLADALAWLRGGVSGSGLDLPGGLRLEREFERLRRRRGADAGPPLRSAADYRILVEREAPSADAAPRDGGDDGPWNLICPADVLQGNLKLRNWREGDRFQPFGLDGTRKLSDLFRERRVPVSERGGVLVVEDDGGILWVVGLERSERTRLLPSGGRTVTLCVVRRASAGAPGAPTLRSSDSKGNVTR